MIAAVDALSLSSLPVFVAAARCYRSLERDAISTPKFEPVRCHRTMLSLIGARCYLNSQFEPAAVITASIASDASAAFDW